MKYLIHKSSSDMLISTTQNVQKNLLIAILLTLGFLTTSCNSNDGEPAEPTPPDATFGLVPEVLHQFDLADQLPALAGFEFRGRKITFEPGSATSDHSHAERPGVLYLIEGSITEYRNGVKRVLEVGDSWVEDADTNHWLTNDTNENAVAIVIDFVSASIGEVDQRGSDTGTDIELDIEEPTETFGLNSEELGLFDISEQIEGTEGIQLRMRRIMIAPEARIASHSHATQPGIVYILEGDLIEVRPERARTFTAGETWFEEVNTIHWVANTTEDPTVILVIDLISN